MTPGELVVRPWHGLEGLRAQREAVLELFQVAAVDPLCNGFDWTLAHAEAFSDPATLFGWTMEQDGLPVAFFAFRREPKRGTLTLTRAILAVDGTFDSDYLDFLLRPGVERAAIESVLDALSEMRGIDSVVVTGVPEESETLAILRDALGARRLPRRERPFPCCAAPLPGTFEEYVSGLKPRMRSKVRSAMRRAEDEGAVLSWRNDPATLDSDLETLFELHQQRWSSAGRPGGFAQDDRRDFYRALATRLLEHDRLGLATLSLDGRVVASQIGALVGGTYYQLQEGFDPDLEKQRVGVALRGWAIRSLIERGVESYDFMAGLASHKTDWGGVLRPCTTIAFALPRVRARMAYGARALVDRWRTSSA